MTEEEKLDAENTLALAILLRLEMMYGLAEM